MEKINYRFNSIELKINLGNIMKILAVASGGGHWKQLMLLDNLFEKKNVYYITTVNGLPQSNQKKNFYIVSDSNKNNILGLFKTFKDVFYITLKERPNMIITTGAAPGLLSILCGRLIGSKTIWIDSIANAEKISLGGNISRKIAHHVFTQWEHLADNDVLFIGSLL